MSSPPSPPHSSATRGGTRGRRVLVLGGLAAVAAGAAAYRRAKHASQTAPESGSAPTATDAAAELAALGWGSLKEPDPVTVTTTDGANLSVWDYGQGPAVVLPHCWGCSHAVWVPVARRLVEAGHRVVLYDQRGHGASSRGTAPLSMETLADDLAAVLQTRDVDDAVLAGHSMGGMTIMSLATYRPEVLAQRAKAVVLVATAAASLGVGSARAEQFAATFIASPLVSRALRSRNGRRFVRGVFGVEPVGAQLDLTRNLFGDCDPTVRAGFLSAMATMDLLEGIATMERPTTVIVGSRDRLTAPARADQMVSTIPGARLVTLKGRGHMLPLEDPDAVADEIIRAVKG